jgi:hypothetical protein
VIRFEEYMGQLIMLGLPDTSGEKDAVAVHLVKLLNVDVGGIWVESKEMTQALRHGLKKADFPAEAQALDFAHFLPYSRIFFVAVSLTKLDPTSLGLPSDS